MDAFIGREVFFSFGRRNREITIKAYGIKATVSVETMGVPDLGSHLCCLLGSNRAVGDIPLLAGISGASELVSVREDS